MARGDPLDRGPLRDVRRSSPRRPRRRARGASTPPGLGGTGQIPAAGEPVRTARYDTIGRTYASRRREEPAWGRLIERALGGAERVINVGAGTGNYEPHDAVVLAVEPSATMLAQRASDAAPAVQGVAEALPVPDDSFDAALAILTVHHWSDPCRGLRELARVAARQVVVTWDPVASSSFWLHRDYLPELLAHEASLSSLADVLDALDVDDVGVLEVPRGCVDGFLGAHWATPADYLDPSVRAGSSGLSLLDQDAVDDAMTRLARDLHDGTWHRRNAELAGLASLDTGFRLVVASATPRPCP